MKKIVSIILAFSLLISIISITSFATDKNLSMEEFYAQVTDVILEYDYDDSGLSGSAETLETHRLIVKTKTNEPLEDYYDAAKVVEGYDGLHILQYQNSEQADYAFKKLCYDNIECVDYDSYFFLDDTESVSETLQTIQTDNQHFSWNSAAVNVDEAFEYINNSEKNCEEITVSVIDTGVYAAHSSFSSSDRIVDSEFYYYLKRVGENDEDIIDKQPSVEDDHNHGTHVTGIIYDNTMENVKIIPYRVSNEDTVLYSNIISAFDKAVSKNVDIINISISNIANAEKDDGGNFCYEVLYRKVTEASNGGIVVVTSAGKADKNVSNFYPACIPSAITVSATDKNHNLYKKNGYGSLVDISAPGVGINSTVPRLWGSKTNGTEEWQVYDPVPQSLKMEMDGTSMAAPLVSAAAATLKSIHPEYTPADIQRIIKETAYVPDNWDETCGGKYYGAGIVNFLNMVKAEVTEVKPTISIKNSKIVITAPEGSDSRIYYSLDGTVPTIDNPLTYTEPIDIGGMNVDTITAVCHENGKLIGDPVTFNTTIRIDLDTLYFRYTTNPMPKEISSMADWRSSNPNIASVDCKGNITGVSPGTTYVYANRADGIKMVYKVTVDYSLWQEILIKLFFDFLWYI